MTERQYINIGIKRDGLVIRCVVWYRDIKDGIEILKCNTENGINIKLTYEEIEKIKKQIYNEFMSTNHIHL